jgi:hypothetical protein
MSSQYGGARCNGLGEAAAAAVRAQEDNQAPCAATTGPSQEQRDHPTQGGQDESTTPVGPPDAEQLGEQAARRLLEAAGRYTRQALQFPGEVQVLRTMLAEALLENGIMRLRVDELESRFDRLEGRVGR